MCGSGTILIEAATIGRNIAPGLGRRFASELWPSPGPEAWEEAREFAANSILPPGDMQIFGYDINADSIRASQINATHAGVEEDIHFEQKGVHDLWIDKRYGIVISNPPYGKRMSEFQEMNQIYIALHKMFKKKTGWSIYILTADKMFPKYFKRAKPDRKRKLYNGTIQVDYYQYYGERPPD